MKFENMINKIINCDCYQMIKNIPDKSIDCVYVDIPYLVKNMISGTGTIKKLSGFTKDNCKRKEKRRNTFEELAKIMDGIDYLIFNEFNRIMKKVNIYIWCSKEQIYEIMKYFVENKQCTFEILVWCKNNPTPFCNNTWLPDVEYCLYFRESGVKLNDGYELKSKWYISPINKSDKYLYNHPTIKPLELVKRHILHTTQPNDIVLDCFCGSGTTCVACKETGRRFIGMEINKEYYDIAQKRINGIMANGQMFMMFNDKGEPLND